MTIARDLVIIAVVTHFCSVQGIQDDGIFWVPYPDPNSWKTAHSHNLVCPPFNKKPSMKNPVETQITVKIPQDSKVPKHVEGFLCHGVTYETACEEGFFGGETQHQLIRQKTVTENECLINVKLWREGKYFEPYFPSVECEWMKTTTKTLDFAVISKHPVLFDPYIDGYRDGLFHGTTCEGEVCRTVHADTLWVTDKPAKAVCPQFLEEKALIIRETYNTTQHAWLELAGSEYHNLMLACTLTFCGEAGVKLRNGHFIVLTNQQHVVRYPCGSDTQITEDSLEGISVEQKRDMEDVSIRMECLDTVQELRAGGKVSYSKLARLQPYHTGLYPVYRINNGTLEYSTAWYFPLASMRQDEKFVIGTLKNSSVAKLVNSVPSGDGKTKSAFNGVHLTDTDTVIVPDLELLKLRYSETLLYLHTQVKFEHPVVEQQKLEGLDESGRKMVKSQGVDVWGWISSVWDSLWGKIMLLCGALLTALITLLIIWCVIKYSIKRCFSGRQQRNEETIPMRDRIIQNPSSGTRIW